MKPANFDYYAPSSVEEALDTLAELGYDGKVLAGGQSLIAAMNFRMARPSALVDLNNVPELSYIKPTADGGLAIGTMTRVHTVEHNAEVAQRFPLLVEVAKFIAHPQIRHRGTFGGAIAHADPAGQLPSISVLMNMQALIKSKGEERWVDGQDLIIGPFMTVIEPHEMLAELVLKPWPARTGSKYVQVSRQSGGYAQSAIASIVTLDEKDHCKDVRMVLMSVGEVPILSQKAGEILKGNAPTREAIEEVAELAASTEIDPATDLHATADYRRSITRVLVVRSLTEAVERAKRGG
ncbi:MAG TPA: xanthine dehydrogenase family protein subunit M [Anaerolineaceae bacterium]|nr:xanthine dehydrogenase family protein subunit M [Anaerolineaceae bacterium]